MLWEICVPGMSASAKVTSQVTWTRTAVASLIMESVPRRATRSLHTPQLRGAVIAALVPVVHEIAGS